MDRKGVIHETSEVTIREVDVSDVVEGKTYFVPNGNGKLLEVALIVGPMNGDFYTIFIWDYMTGGWRDACYSGSVYEIKEAAHGIPAAPAQPAPAPTSWMEMVTANLVREGVNKHKARELAEHFYSLAPAAQPAVPLTPAEVHGMAEAHGIDGDARHWYVVGITDSEKHHKITKGQP